MELIEAVRTIGEIRQLATLMSAGPEGQEARWNSLQAWLKKNPKYEAMINHCLTLTPAQAVPWLCEQLSFDAHLLHIFDPQKQLQAMAEKVIADIQTLCNERKEFYAKTL